MKTRSLSLPLLIFLLLTPSVSAFTPPSWFKNGTYVTYIIPPEEGEYKDSIKDFMYVPSALSRENHEIITRAFENGPPSCQKDARDMKDPKHQDSLWDLFPSGSIYLTINITSVVNNTAVIRITLTMNNVSTGLGGGGCTVKNITLKGELLLNLTDGYYYLNGTRIGMPTFFINPSNLPQKNTVIYRASILRKHGFTTNDVKIAEITFAQNKTAHTFVKTFYPPIIKMTTNNPPLLFLGNGRLSAALITYADYDFETGIALGMDSPYPEYYAVGIMYAVGDVNYGLNQKMDFSKEYWPYGFILYRTNIQFPREESGRAPDTVLKYYLVLGLIVLTALTLWRWRK